MGLLDKFLGGDSEEDETQNPNQDPFEPGNPPESEQDIQETSEIDTETLTVGDYEVEVSEPTDTDHEITDVEDPVKYLVDLNDQVRESVFSNLSDELSRELGPDVQETIRTRKGAEMTVRTPSFWKKRPDATEALNEVADEAGIETEELYKDLESEEAREVLESFVNNVVQPYERELVTLQPFQL
jgi:hypothetical protein